jgi:hypothetical protein
MDAGMSGIPAATSGASGLASAIIGNPQRIAQARYLGAGTAEEMARAAAQQTDNQSVAAFQQMAADPSNYTPQGISKMMALAAGSPTLSARAAQLVSASMAGQAAPGNGTGAPGSPTVAQASNFGALSGVTNYGQTPTGYSAGLANQIQQSQISAGATVASADISAKAAEADTAATIQGENQRTLVQVNTPNGPSYMPATEAGATGAPYYDPNVAQIAARPVTVQGPAGPRLMTTGQAMTTQATPLPDTTDQAKAQVFSGAVNPPTQAAMVPAQPPGGLAATMAAGTQPPAAAPAPTQAPGGAAVITPDQRAQIVGNTVAGMTGQPMPGQVNPQQAAQMDQLITGRLEAGHPTRMGSNVPSQSLMNPIRLQAAWLLNHDPNVRGNVQQAVTQAIINVTGKDGSNVTQNLHVLPAMLGGQPGPSQLVPVDPSKIAWPAGMPVPQEYQAPGQGQPSGLANTIANGSGQPGAPAAQPGQPGQPGQPAQPAPPQNLQASQIMGQAQDAINAVQASNDTPVVKQQKIQMIKQRLEQMGVLPNLPPGTPH